MGLKQNSIVVYSDHIEGIDERYSGLKVYINPDLTSERNCYTPKGYLERYTAKICQSSWKFHTFTTRYCGQKYNPIPVSDKKIFMLYAQRECSDRYCYTILDTSWKYCYTEGKVTNTPLIMKYPKYYNLPELPLAIYVDFKVYSFYKLDLDTLYVLIKDKTNNKTWLFHYPKDKDKFKVEIKKLPIPSRLEGKVLHKDERNFEYHIILYPNITLEPSSEIDIYVSVYDIFGQPIKKEW
jgi:hypothetical protein